MSNRWSRRRKTIKRPPVCRSIAPQPDNQAWPSLHIEPQWILVTDPMQPCSMSPASFPMVQVGTTNEYGLIFADDQTDSCVATIFLGLAPAQTTVLIEITTGPYAGVTFFALVPGWDGTNMWDSVGNPLTIIGGTGFAQVDLHVP